MEEEKKRDNITLKRITAFLFAFMFVASGVLIGLMLPILIGQPQAYIEGGNTVAGDDTGGRQANAEVTAVPTTDADAAGSALGVGAGGLGSDADNAAAGVTAQTGGDNNTGGAVSNPGGTTNDSGGAQNTVDAARITEPSDEDGESGGGAAPALITTTGNKYTGTQSQGSAEGDVGTGGAAAGDNPSAAAAPTPEPEVLAYVSQMTLREKICQMMIVIPDSITGVSGTTVVGNTTKTALNKYPVGGIIHLAPNIESEEQIRRFNRDAQSHVKTPMFIAVDEEGGTVTRLGRTIGAHSLHSMLSYESEGTDGARRNAVTLAEALKKYDFNTDFAPVADVWSNPANTVIGERAYSRDFDDAARLVSAAVRGFGESGVLSCVKHFPGHGDTGEDSHYKTAYVKKTLEELRDNEFKPFEAGIAAGVDMVMVGHLVVPEVDELPATLSERLITGVLRGELGFDGVVITDALAMGAITSNYSDEYVAVQTVKAGVDILLEPNNIERTINALTAAVDSGDIPESRIDESVSRIISLKRARGIFNID